MGDIGVDTARSLVLGDQLLVHGAVVSRAVLWPESFKYLALPDPSIEIEQAQEVLRLRAQRPAKGIWLSAGDGVAWSDNMLDLLPDDEQTVVAHGPGEREVQMRWLR